MTRRTWTIRAIAEIARSQRYGRALSRATLDLDHFKLINDTHRHAVGGKVIKRLACLCMSTVRQSHLFARFGGEEFVLIMPETNVAESLLAAERLRTMFANATDHAAGPVACTVSIGIAGLAACNANPDALLHVAAIGCGR